LAATLFSVVASPLYRGCVPDVTLHCLFDPFINT